MAGLLGWGHAEAGFRTKRSHRSLRLLSRGIIFLLRLNGETRWSNEFIQALDPKVTVSLKNVYPDINTKSTPLSFRTGHGRLYCRCRHSIYEEPETNDWIKSFREEDILYDVGANIGVYSLLASKLFGIRTIAVEPDLMNARMLYGNIFLNDVTTKVTVPPVAVADRNYNGNLFLKSVGYGDALHNLDERNLLAVSNPHLGCVASLPVFTLDTLVSVMDLPTPTKLKIDVDGAELRVLQGAETVLESITSIMLELDEKNGRSELVCKHLADRGFTKKFESDGKSYHMCTNVLFKRR